jgi:tetratricopeptide (TPR) repeat protein
MNLTLALAEQLRLQQGQAPELILPAAQALLLAAQQAGDPSSLLQASLAIGTCLLQMRDLPQARQWFLRALDLCRMHRDLEAETYIRGQLGLIHLLQGHYELALDQFQLGRTLLGDGHDPQQQLELLHNTAVVLHRLEQFPEAVLVCEEQLALGRKQGFSGREELRCLLNMARSLDRAGRLDEAERVAREAFSGLHRAGSSGLVAYCQSLQAHIAQRRGQHSMAALLARESRLSLLPNAPEEERLEVLLILGRCEGQAGEATRAEQVFREAVDLAERRDLHQAAMDCCQELARLLAARGSWEEALAWQELALEHHKLHHQAELARHRVQSQMRLQDAQSGWRNLLTDPSSLPEAELRQASEERAPLPICSCCKKIRGESSLWKPLEGYFLDNHGLMLSHGLCPDCATDMYQELLESAPSA